MAAALLLLFFLLLLTIAARREDQLLPQGARGPRAAGRRRLLPAQEAHRAPVVRAEDRRAWTRGVQDTAGPGGGSATCDWARLGAAAASLRGGVLRLRYARGCGWRWRRRCGLPGRGGAARRRG
ncbi:hypothetical protein PAL_GLEAN10007453 [Pteropus alecto]|uniref:Uncharacterized protein n=1 Tax=Pteropus alecto TaxID=9402 RepID=L5L424_PTEAL|nr:hypothetical protein PAL_GLEAN10007453 [Pteropus alecto]